MKPFKVKGSPYYQVRVMVKGRTYVRSTKKTDLREAIVWGRQFKQELLRDSDAASAMFRSKTSYSKLSEVFEAYERQAQGWGLRKTTIDLYKDAVLRLFRAKETDSAGVITHARVMAFREEFLKGYDTVEARMSREETLCSIVRRAQALFGRKVRYEGLNLPDVKDAFRGVISQKRIRVYNPMAKELREKLDAASLEVKAINPGIYAAYLLARYCGLRAGEIEAAKWSWIVETPNGFVLSVGVDGNFSPKRNRMRLVPVAKEVVEALSSVRDGDHLVPGDAVRVVRREVNRWLRINGLRTIKGLHELRKLAGSEIATRHGLFAAQRVLGHANPATTSAYYAGLTELPAALGPASGAGA